MRISEVEEVALSWLRSHWTKCRIAALVGLCSSLTLALPASGLEPTVTTQYFNSIDISSFEDCSWRQGQKAASFEVEAAIRQAVEKQLAKKGYPIVDEDEDCWVRTGGMRGQNLPIGVLVVEISESSSGKIAWQGKATGMADFSAKEGPKIVSKAIKRMFKQFPRAR